MLKKLNPAEVIPIISSFTIIIICVTLLFLQLDARAQRKVNKARQDRIICLLEIRPEDRNAQARQFCLDKVNGVQ